jgi:hypothetical protein
MKEIRLKYKCRRTRRREEKASGKKRRRCGIG